MKTTNKYRLTVFLHKMLQWLGNLKLFCYSDIKPRTMPQDSFLQLVDSTVSLDTSSILRDIIHFAILSPDPKPVINRFMVQGITHCKDQPTTPQHEFIVVELMDTSLSGSEPLFVFLERTASNERPPSTYFGSHPDSTSVLNSIVQTLKEMPDLLLSRNDSDSSLPLRSSDPADIPLLSYVAESQSDVLASSESPSHRFPYFDAASLKSAKAVQSSMHSTGSSKVYHADDRFIGAKHFNAYMESMHNVRQIRPQSLSLFDLVVLADTVHNHDPLYSMLRSQCFWFAATICNVIEKGFTCSTVTSEEFVVSKDDIIVPVNNYLPNLAGRWMGILVSKVEVAVSTVVASNFLRYRQEKRDEVSLLLIVISTC